MKRGIDRSRLTLAPAKGRARWGYEPPNVRPNDGKPRRFVFDDQQQRFIPGQQIATKGPELILLGPSMGLVKKHWDRLPIGTYMLMAHRSRLPVKSITPSNQLSYVVRLGFAGQGLLVSGDAGCVDFRPSTQADFAPDLLKPLLPLHVIQVAHHGGNNADFYNVLVDCGYGQQTAPSWLLLSHATEDKYRPSPCSARSSARCARPATTCASSSRAGPAPTRFATICP